MYGRFNKVVSSRLANMSPTTKKRLYLTAIAVEEAIIILEIDYL